MKFSLHNKNAAFTLVEVVMAAALGSLTVGAGLYGYVLSARRAEWSGYSLAAHSLAVQGVEQARAAKWDPTGSQPDELVSSNFPSVVNILDIPISGTNIVYATNFTTISYASTNPSIKMIRVDCVWKFIKNGPFTNTVITYRAPDQ
jgi:hypothetical protein